MVVEPELPNSNPMTPSQTSVNNSIAGYDDENLPPVTDAQGNIIPLTEFGGMDDYAEEPTPTEVRRASANIPETGVLFNLAPFEQIAQLYAAGQKDEARKIYDSLDEQAKYVYKNARNMERFTAQEGARLADEFRQKRDAASTPQAEAAQMRVDSIKQGSVDDAKKTYQRASNMIFLLDNLRGGNRETAKKGEEAWRPRVGRIQGGMHNPGGWMPQLLTTDKDLGWVADFNSLKGMINLTEAQENRGQGQFSDGERVLMAQAASLGLERQRDEPGFEAAFERMYDMALEAQQAAAQKMSGETGNAPAPAPAGSQSAAAPAAPAATPAARPQAGFQVGKPYLDAQRRQRIFRGYAQDGRPLFSQ